MMMMIMINRRIKLQGGIIHVINQQADNFSDFKIIAACIPFTLLNYL